jgi:hypothetical protein
MGSLFFLKKNSSCIPPEVPAETKTLEWALGLVHDVVQWIGCLVEGFPTSIRSLRRVESRRNSCLGAAHWDLSLLPGYVYNMEVRASCKSS